MNQSVLPRSSRYKVSLNVGESIIVLVSRIRSTFRRWLRAWLLTGSITRVSKNKWNNDVWTWSYCLAPKQRLVNTSARSCFHLSGSRRRSGVDSNPADGIEKSDVVFSPITLTSSSPPSPIEYAFTHIARPANFSVNSRYDGRIGSG